MSLEQIKEEWQRKNEGRLVKVVDKRSGYGGRLENLGGLSDLGYELTDFDEAHLQHRMEYERDAHCSAQSGYTDSYSLNTYSDALYTFGNENNTLINTAVNITRANNVGLENEEIVKQTSRFFGLNLVRFSLILIYSP